jgi:hypothetical protein
MNKTSTVAFRETAFFPQALIRDQIPAQSRFYRIELLLSRWGESIAYDADDCELLRAWPR